jgi:hypothetical protein
MSFFVTELSIFLHHAISMCIGFQHATGFAYIFGCIKHRVRRLATATLWRTFHHDGKISPGWWEGGGARPTPYTISTITYKAVVYINTLQLIGQIHSHLKIQDIEHKLT